MVISKHNKLFDKTEIKKKFVLILSSFKLKKNTQEIFKILFEKIRELNSTVLYHTANLTLWHYDLLYTAQCTELL